MGAEKLDLLVTDSFWGWLRKEKKNWISIIPVLPISLAFTILKWVGDYTGAFESFNKNLVIWLIVAQTAVIGALLFIIPEPVEDPLQSRRATIAINQFHQAWRMLWVFWFMEYIGLSWHEYSWPKGGAPEYIPIVLNVLNNLPTMALVVCYIISTERTVQEKHGHYSGKALPWDRLVVILTAITLIEALIRYKVIDILPVSTGTEYPDIFSWLSGVGAGTATALIIGRLDSKFINLPFVIIGPLYFYAVIQAGWAPLLKDPTTRAVLLNLAFALKCLLFAVVQWLLKSGVLLFYLEKVGFLIDQVNPERRKFLHRVQRNIGIAAEEEPEGEMERVENGRQAL